MSEGGGTEKERMGYRQKFDFKMLFLSSSTAFLA